MSASQEERKRVRTMQMASHACHLSKIDANLEESNNKNPRRKHPSRPSTTPSEHLFGFWKWGMVKSARRWPLSLMAFFESERRFEMTASCNLICEYSYFVQMWLILPKPNTVVAQLRSTLMNVDWRRRSSEFRSSDRRQLGPFGCR